MGQSERTSEAGDELHLPAGQPATDIMGWIITEQIHRTDRRSVFFSANYGELDKNDHRIKISREKDKYLHSFSVSVCGIGCGIGPIPVAGSVHHYSPDMRERLEDRKRRTTFQRRFR